MSNTLCPDCFISLFHNIKWLTKPFCNRFPAIGFCCFVLKIPRRTVLNRWVLLYYIHKLMGLHFAFLKSHFEISLIYISIRDYAIIFHPIYCNSGFHIFHWLELVLIRPISSKETIFFLFDGIISDKFQQIRMN